jgi:hypothetical protein
MGGQSLLTLIIGAHYTSETNILKVIKPLFLDSLRADFEKLKARKDGGRVAALKAFHENLSKLTFFDPACGCGNFLVVAYRELRELELDVIACLEQGQQTFDISALVKVNVNQFYGIEIGDFPAQIAETALWLMDHIENTRVQERFGQYYVRIPLTAAAHIHCQNALTSDWKEVLDPAQCFYILGNPPFLGYSVMSKEQKTELKQVFDHMEGCGVLDYVSCWYKKAVDYLQGTQIEAAFVSTNSITQGEQVPVLWPHLFSKGFIINFAHQTFKWSNEAARGQGMAAVYCVIIGFALYNQPHKRLFSYADIAGEASESPAKEINAYLIDAPQVFIQYRRQPICKVSPMIFGNKPVDDGNFFLKQEEKDAILEKEPDIAPLIRPFLGAEEFINAKKRYCIWLDGVAPSKYRNSKEIERRIEAIKAFRLASKKEATRKLADFPSLFGEIRQPDSNYLLVPGVSSEKRKYIPVGFISKDVIVGNSCSFIPNATLYEFGVITSALHMAWMRVTAGRLTLRYRYSGAIVYNNFPWPTPTDKQEKAIEEAAQAVLDARALYPDESMADLYDPLAMPAELTKAHQTLDKAVDAAYNRKFASDSERVAWLFELYQQQAGELFTTTQKKGKGRKAK